MWIEAFLCYVSFITSFVNVRDQKNLRTDKNLFGRKIMSMPSHLDSIKLQLMETNREQFGFIIFYSISITMYNVYVVLYDIYDSIDITSTAK